jgi:hypothetical protein
MSVDAACTACCCTVAPSICCFPDASKPLEVNFSWRYSIFAGTTEVGHYLLSGQVTTMMQRYPVGIPPNNTFEMRSVGGTLSLRYELSSKVAKQPVQGSSCPGFPNDYYCPASNEFVHCESNLITYSGSLPNNSVSITCGDPCPQPDPLFGRRTYFLSGYIQDGNNLLCNFTQQTGNNEPSSPCGPPGSTNSTITFADAFNNQVFPFVRMIGKEGCLDSSTFQAGHVQPALVGPPEFDGPCSPNATYSAEVDCNQWRTNPSYTIPPKMGFFVSSCPVLRCNPYGGGLPTYCILFDCFGNVISYSVSGCDTIYPGNNEGTAAEISVFAELSMSNSVTYG